MEPEVVAFAWVVIILAGLVIGLAAGMAIVLLESIRRTKNIEVFSNELDAVISSLRAQELDIQKRGRKTGGVYRRPKTAEETRLEEETKERLKEWEPDWMGGPDETREEET